MTVEKIPRVRPPYPFEDYRFEIRPLARAEGGGYLISFPDLPGCISDGETISDAVRHGKQAFESWMSVRLHDRLPVPEPSRGEERTLDGYSGRFVQRIPRSLHAELASRADAEGVSLNSLVLALIANGLGRLRNANPDREGMAIVAEPAAAYRTRKRVSKIAAQRAGET